MSGAGASKVRGGRGRAWQVPQAVAPLCNRQCFLLAPLANQVPCPCPDKTLFCPAAAAGKDWLAQMSADHLQRCLHRLAQLEQELAQAESQDEI